jgi:hypothetical protein
MNWSMPRPLVQGVAALLLLIAAGSFAAGVMHAPERGRLPGERAPGTPGPPATAIVATEATPLAPDRIEGPPPAPKPQKSDQATNTEAETADAADQLNPAAPPKPALPPKTNATAPGPPPAQATGAGDLTNSIPPDEEPPH